MLVQRVGLSLESWGSLKELRRKLEPLCPLKLIAATDGNHGRAVARIAALLGFGARIFVPGNTTAARVKAIDSEGTEVVIVEGSYEDAVSQAVKEQSLQNLLVQDITLPGDEDIPRWAVEGYSTIFWEIDGALKAQGERDPDLVVAQIGGGSFAAAPVRNYRQNLPSPPRIVGIEPECAASTLASMEAGHVVTIPGPHTSIMAGLNCGTVSLVAWPVLKAGIGLLCGHWRPPGGGGDAFSGPGGRDRRRNGSFRSRVPPRTPYRTPGGKGPAEAQHRALEPHTPRIDRRGHRPGGVPQDRGRGLKAVSVSAPV